MTTPKEAYEAQKTRKIKVAAEQQSYAEKREAMRDLSDEVSMLTMQRLKQFLNGEIRLDIEKVQRAQGDTNYQITLAGFPSDGH